MFFNKDVPAAATTPQVSNSFNSNDLIPNIFDNSNVTTSTKPDVSQTEKDLQGLLMGDMTTTSTQVNNNPGNKIDTNSILKLYGNTPNPVANQTNNSNNFMNPLPFNNTSGFNTQPAPNAANSLNFL